MPKPKSVHKTPRWQSYVFLLINLVCWGAALPLVKPALVVTSPFRYLFYRYILAVVLTIPILWYYWPKIKLPWKQIKMITAIEIIGTTISLSLLYFGLRYTTAIEAGLIGNMSPIFTTLGCVFFLREKEERHEWVGLFIAFISTIFFALLPAIQLGHLPNNFSLFGNLLIFGQNIVNVFFIILVKKYYHPLPKLFITTISFYVGLITFGAFSFLESGSVAAFTRAAQIDFQSPSVWIAVVYMAIFGSIIGLTAHIKGQDAIEASEATLFGYLQPLVYIPLSIWLLGESIQVIQLLPLGGVILGVFLAEKRFSKVAQRKAAGRKTNGRTAKVIEDCCQKPHHHHLVHK